MRSIALSKSGLNKIRSYQLELKSSDLEDSVKSLPPGEWCEFKVAQESWIGFINPLVEDKFACAYVLTKFEPSFTSPENYIIDQLLEAKSKRNRFLGYDKNIRLFYGTSDGLPGLIIDQFQNVSIVQINTAGIDRYRELIKNELLKLTSTSVYFLDNPKYREKESLPTFENEVLPDLQIFENDIEFRIRSTVMQKVGFYFDHRENRLQLMNILSRLQKKPSKGADLFSYAGAWGLAALKAGVSNVSFIDQGDFELEVNNGLELNNFHSRGKYIRSDVFRFLDEALKQNERFDLILCDPPAFAKSALQKSQALDGYSKLHRKVFKLLAPESLVAFSSCTHYVNHEEFQKNILDASFKENRKIQLIYSGMQGFDHPILSLNERASYIKSYFYLVE